MIFTLGNNLKNHSSSSYTSASYKWEAMIKLRYTNIGTTVTKQFIDNFVHQTKKKTF